MPLDFIICMEMSGNGAKMTSIQTMTKLLGMVLLGWKAIVKVLIEFYAVVHGATLPCIAVLPIAPMIRVITVTTLLVFE